MQFANPAALYALLALPVIVAIHFLQQRSRRVRVSTLFLLDHSAPISVAGARFERLRNSLPLWLQLLAACIVVWLLSEPRWLRENSRQSIAIVLDSSVSMSAFQDASLDPALSRALAPWARTATSTDWVLLESDTRKPVLYRGPALAPLLDSLKSWHPTRGTHDASDALTLARSLVKASGTVLFVTDRTPPPLPSDIGVIAIGEPFANVGFAGLEMKSATVGEDLRWSVLVRNHSQDSQAREWWVEWPSPDATTESSSTSKSSITLNPGQTLTLSGALPLGIDQAIVQLSPDRFTIDDSLPLRRPAPRQLTAAIALTEPAQQRLFSELLSALDHLQLGNSDARDLVVSEIGTAATTHAIQISSGDGVGAVASLDPAPVLAETHPLTRDLDWASLLTAAPTDLTLSDNDQPLLWKGNRPLALLRQDTQDDGRVTQRLLLGWNPLASSAARNPALVVMFHRFVEDLRQRKRHPFADNFETDQPLALGFPAQAPRTLRLQDKNLPFRNRTPDSPGFFELHEGTETVLSAAAAFGDVREADFTQAATFDETATLRRESAMKQTEADPYTPLWLLGLIACLLVSWHRP